MCGRSTATPTNASRYSIEEWAVQGLVSAPRRGRVHSSLAEETIQVPSYHLEAGERALLWWSIT
eukprot:scaffold2217_cov209-Prasinococcus_capsulatus_cf.AAC.1